MSNDIEKILEQKVVDLDALHKAIKAKRRNKKPFTFNIKDESDNKNNKDSGSSDLVTFKIGEETFSYNKSFFDGLGTAQRNLNQEVLTELKLDQIKIQDEFTYTLAKLSDEIDVEKREALWYVLSEIRANLLYTEKNIKKLVARIKQDF